MPTPPFTVRVPSLKRRRYSVLTFRKFWVLSVGVIVASDCSSMAQKYGARRKPPRCLLLPKSGTRKPLARRTDGSVCQMYGK